MQSNNGTASACCGKSKTFTKNPRRTARPTSSKQLWTLFKARVAVDYKNKLVILFRLFLAPFLTYLYAVIAYRPDASTTDSGISEIYKPRFNLDDFSLDTFLSSQHYPPLHFDLGSNKNSRISFARDTERLLFGGKNVTAIKELTKHMNINENEIDLSEIQDIESFEEHCSLAFLEDQILAGIFFHDASGPSFKYGIYLNEAFSPNTTVATLSSPDPNSVYLTSGFFAVQKAVEESIVLLHNQTNTEFNFGQELAYILDSRQANQRPDWLLLWLPGFFFLLGCMPTVMIMLNSMMYEKICHFVRAFNLVGVKVWVYWMHWWLLFSIGTVITAAVYTAVWVNVNYSAYSDPGFVYIWIQLCLLGLVAFAMVVVSYTSDEDSSNMVGFLTTMSFGVIYIPVLLYDAHVAIQSVLTVICPLFGIMQGSALFALYGSDGLATGITSSTIVDSGGLQLYFAQMTSLVLWTLWALLFRADSPRKHRVKNISEVLEDAVKSEDIKVDMEQQDGEDNALVVRLRGLEKVFSTPDGEIKAVDGLDMDIYRNEVYGFLGHNGGGKSTTISMISGEFPPTDGDVEYHFGNKIINLSSVDDVSLIQSNVGVCPQENILFDNMTCREHLYLFAKLKGNISKEPGQTDKEAIEAEVQRRIDDMQFTSDVDEVKKISAFSGGMKRKVSIAIAMLGNPELLMLDEPTAGMDPYSRRLVWDMIAKAKKGRSIMLTTHFMDEADILSDRIGIINKGKIVARGTSLSLKHEFGAGYHLNFIFESEDDAHLKRIYDGIVERVPGSKFDYREKKVHYFKLSYEEKLFPALLDWLDTEGCSGISLQLTTLEEVFLRTGAENVDEKDVLGSPLPIKSDGSGTEMAIESPTTADADSFASVKDIWVRRHKNPGLRVRVWAVAMVICKGSLRQIGFIIFNIVMPLFLLLIGFVAGLLIAPPKSDDQIKTLELGTSILTEHIPHPIFFGFPNVENETIYGIEYTSNVPNIMLNNSDNNFAGGVDLDALVFNFNSTVAPSISLLYSAVTNMTLQNVSKSFGVQAILNSVKSGSAQGLGLDFTNISNLFVPLFTNLGLLPMSYCILTVVMLRDDGCLALFRTMGVSKAETYLAVILSRYLFFFVPVFTFSIFFGLAFQSPVMGNGGRWLGFILLLFCYGYSLVPFSLIFRPIFNSKKSAQSVFPPVWNMLNIFPFIIYFALLSIPEYQDVAVPIGDALSLLPPFAYQRAVSNLISLDFILNEDILSVEQKWQIVWSWQARIWYSILLMMGIGTLSWVYLAYQVSAISCCQRNSQEVDGKVVESKSKMDDILSVSHLTKVFEQLPRRVKKSAFYRSRYINPYYWAMRIFGIDPFEEEYMKTTVVNDISFGVNPGEDIVLVGPSGAGKTVLTKMTLGEIIPNSGMVISRGKPVEFSKMYASGFMGYCPQFDAFMSKKLKVEEQLDMATRVRGMGRYKYESGNKDTEHIDALVKILGLHKHMYKFSENLSGGYKRKLSLAIAIISRPEVCIFDEPTTGVDPGSRHEIWALLNPRRKEEIDLPAIIMSTHDMSEAEALATNVGVVINGELIAKGTIPELVEKYCTYFFIEITTDFDKTQAGEDFLMQNIPDAILVDSVQGRLKFKVPHQAGEIASKHLGLLFQKMEEMKSKMDSPIKYYSVAQMTLEQIFIALSKAKFDTNNK